MKGVSYDAWGRRFFQRSVVKRPGSMMQVFSRKWAKDWYWSWDLKAWVVIDRWRACNGLDSMGWEVIGESFLRRGRRGRDAGSAMGRGALLGLLGRYLGVAYLEISDPVTSLCVCSFFFLSTGRACLSNSERHTPTWGESRSNHSPVTSSPELETPQTSWLSLITFDSTLSAQ